MRSFPRFISKQISWFIPVKTLFKSHAPVFLPFYHVVSNNKLPHILNYNFRTLTQFEKELDFFLKYFKPVSLEYLLEHPKPGEKIFHISFDDGLKECATIVAPILLKKGIPATFFVNSGFIDNRELFHKYKASLVLDKLQNYRSRESERILKQNNLEGRKILNASILQLPVLDEVAKILEIDFNSFLKQENPYLSTNQVLKLKTDGFSIGAHSEHHPEFWKIPEEAQYDEVKKSMIWLNEAISPDIKAFSFPFTDDGIPKNLLQQIKNDDLCDITFGTAGLKYDEFQFHRQRYPVEQNGGFEINLRAEFVYFHLRKWIGKAIVKH